MDAEFCVGVYFPIRLSLESLATTRVPWPGTAFPLASALSWLSGSALDKQHMRRREGSLLCVT